MTCRDCINLTPCESLAMANFDHAHRMWMVSQDGAEQRCKWFKERDEKEVKDGARCKVD